MDDIAIREHRNQRILTTAQVAEFLGTDVNNINVNFSRNKDRYVLGEDYFILEGSDLKKFKYDYLTPSNIVDRSPKLHLWTEFGVMLHAKSLNTDEAWEKYKKLVRDYFRLKQDRDEEIADPEKAIARGIRYLKYQGYSDEWIAERLKGIGARNAMTDEWKGRDLEESLDYAILTNTVNKWIFGLATQDHKNLKGIPRKSNLRDHMTTIELAVTSMTETVATQIHRERDSHGFDELKRDVDDAGKIGRDTRLAIEKITKSPVVSPQNNIAQRKQVKRG